MLRHHGGVLTLLQPTSCAKALCSSLSWASKAALLCCSSDSRLSFLPYAATPESGRSQHAIQHTSSSTHVPPQPPLLDMMSWRLVSTSMDTQHEDNTGAYDTGPAAHVPRRTLHQTHTHLPAASPQQHAAQPHMLQAWHPWTAE
jgi:hypothetical protein